MIKEVYVSYETSKLLKEKGFSSDDCHTAYDEDKVFFWYGDYSKDRKGIVDAPTQALAMKWLREKNWFICIIPLAFYCGEKACKFGYNIWADDNLEIDEFDTPKFNTYEEAAESAIKYCLEKLI